MCYGMFFYIYRDKIIWHHREVNRCYLGEQGHLGITDRKPHMSTYKDMEEHDVFEE